MKCIPPLDSIVQSIGLSATFLILLPWTLAGACRSDVKVRPNSLGTAKFVICLVLIAVKLAEVVAHLTSRHHDALKLSAVVLSLVASIGVTLLSAVAHKRLLKAVNLLVFYLLISSCCDVLSARRLMTADHINYSECFPLATGVIRFVMLFLECVSKDDIFLPQYKGLAPVETESIINSVLFWWVNKFLAKGNKHILQDADIPPLDSHLKANGLNQTAKHAWSTRAIPETRKTLYTVLLKTHARPFIITMIPRICVAVSECAQPLLIKAVVRYLESPRGETTCQQYYLVAAAAVVYISSVFSSSIYFYQSSRLELMVKSSLISLIYDKTLTTAAHASDTGKAMTVMSTDVEAISDAPAMFHDGIGQALELILGLLILSDQVKWLWPVPLVIIFFCSKVSQYVAKNIRTRQRNWNEASERRLGALGSILGSMKSVKALGITETLVSYVASLRKDELDRAGEKRFMDCQYNSSANALGLFSPAITIALFSIVSHIRAVPMDIAVVFATVAALKIVTHPANMIMTIYPRMVSVAASFERLQEFLLLSPLRDTRRIHTSIGPANTNNGTAIAVTDVSVQGSGTQPILNDISLKLSYGSVTVCCGAVGSGKSVLGRTIIGEIPTTDGLVEVASERIGFCDQSPWVVAGTVKQVICAFSTSIDEARYKAVIKACCLEHDIDQLQEGDELCIGSRGVNLSGGQAQRIALARLLYSGETIVVLDDSFAALDGTTESQVIQNLLSQGGLLRKNGAAVFWITNSAQYFHLADHIILLEKGKMSHQGSAKEMNQYVTELQKFHVANEPPSAESHPVHLAKTQVQKDMEADLYRQTGDFSLYRFYFNSTGFLAPLAVFGTTATYAVFNTSSTYWIKFWADTDGQNTLIFSVGYLFMAFMAWAATTLHMWTTLFLLAQRSGIYMHNALTVKIFGAPLSYFVTTDIGVTLNRFSQDINLVDRQLPNSFARFVTQCCKMTVQIIILSLVQNSFAFVVPICAVVVYFVQRVYLRTSRQVRVLELEAKASLYSGFHETIDGLSTIRAFGWQRAAEKRNINAIDWSTRPLFFLRCLNRWLSLVMELIVNTIAVGIVATSVIGGKGNGTQIGVALNLVILANSTLIALVGSFTNLEISLGAVARLKNVQQYTAQEDLPEEIIMPDEHWPARGDLVLENVSSGYKTDHNVLSQLNLVAKAGQKLIVCGRTGSGKSTVFMSLLRLIESTGAIEVDGTNILQVPRSVVRNRCFIAVPQEGILFRHAPLRFNLDPTATVDNSKLKAALKATGLSDMFFDTDDETLDVLDKKLSSFPPMSAGQVQLFALARALVQKHRGTAAEPYSDDEDGYPHRAKPIVLLDELTAFMDSATEGKVYDIIDKEFVSEGHTVIFVSHRLGGLLGRLRDGVDAVAVLKDGQLTVETDLTKLLKFESSDDESK